MRNFQTSFDHVVEKRNLCHGMTHVPKTETITKYNALRYLLFSSNPF